MNTEATDTAPLNLPADRQSVLATSAAGSPGDHNEFPTDLRPWFLTLRDIPPAPLKPADIFATEQPLEVEIGSGRGLFLVNAGLTCPGTNFLGVEYDYKEARRAARAFARKRNFSHRSPVGGRRPHRDARLPAVGMCPCAARLFSGSVVEAAGTKKRRIFSAEFLVQAARILEPGAPLAWPWTDVEEYFGVMTSLVAENPAFVPLPVPAERTALHDMDYHTSFERKKRKLGLPIFRARWQRPVVRFST